MLRLQWALAVLMLASFGAQSNTPNHVRRGDYGSWQFFQGGEAHSVPWAYTWAEEFPAYGRGSMLVIACDRDVVDATGLRMYLYTGRSLHRGSGAFPRAAYPFEYQVLNREPVAGIGDFDGISFMFRQDDIPILLREMLSGWQMRMTVSTSGGDKTFSIRFSGVDRVLASLGCYTGPPV